MSFFFILCFFFRAPSYLLDFFLTENMKFIQCGLSRIGGATTFPSASQECIYIFRRFQSIHAPIGINNFRLLLWKTYLIKVMYDRGPYSIMLVIAINHFDSRVSLYRKVAIFIIMCLAAYPLPSSMALTSMTLTIGCCLIWMWKCWKSITHKWLLLRNLKNELVWKALSSVKGTFQCM